MGDITGWIGVWWSGACAPSAHRKLRCKRCLSAQLWPRTAVVLQRVLGPWGLRHPSPARLTAARDTDAAGIFRPTRWDYCGASGLRAPQPSHVQHAGCEALKAAVAALQCIPQHPALLSTEPA